MQHCMFCIGKEAFCVWDHDIRKQNMGFLQSIDHKYWEYVAQVNGQYLDGEEKQRAAITLRIAYYHGLETLFALLCASLQAPDCVYAWVQKYRISQVRELVSKIDTEQCDFIHKFSENDISWSGLSRHVHCYSNPDPERAQETISLFAQLWKRFAYDYLQEIHTNEYNQIKHGFRTRLGGFGLAVGIEEEFGVPAPEENMQTMAYSQFGTSFWAQEAIINSPHKRDWHFTTKYHAVNWNPEALGYALILISMSINNTLSYLKIVNGVQPEDLDFIRPQDSEIFDKPWQNSHSGVVSVGFGGRVEESQIRRFSKKEIQEYLEKTKDSR